jgi:hypothetical protein
VGQSKIYPATRIAALALLLAILASAYLIRGLQVGFSERGSYDLDTRLVEFELFSAGVYPNSHLATNALPGEDLPNSVYPPYAFPLFAPFFITDSEFVARLTLATFSLIALLAIATFGFRELSFASWQGQALGAVAGLAIAHNSSALAFGQFSIVCMGLLALQLHCLRRGGNLAAGFCWALAMIKPQIAIAFALPFLLERRWHGLVFGLALLAALSAFTCYYTRVSPLAVFDYWVVRESFEFIVGGGSRGSSIGGLFAAWGANPRWALGFSALVAMSAIATLLWWARNRSVSLLTLVAVCAIVGRVFIPHRAYDNIMLFPALLALLVLAFERPTLSRCVWAGLFGISVWLPWTSLVRAIWLDAALLAFWFVAALVLIRENISPKNPDRVAFARPARGFRKG